MSFFSSPQSYLGIDIDSHSIKIVELKNEKGRPRLLTYGYFDHDIEKKFSDKDESARREASAIIREICLKSKTASKLAISSLPAFSVFSSVLILPAMSKRELGNAIKWEAKKVIPLPLEDMILHWDILEEEAGKAAGASEEGKDAGEEKEKGFLHIARSKNLQSSKILLTAAPKDMVLRYLDIFKDTGLTLLSLDTEQFALIRSLVGRDFSTMMIVDIDFTVTNIMVIQKGIPYLNRSINVGGLTITKAIANSLNISLKRAEQFKYDIGLSQGEGGQNEIPKTIESSIAPIVDEIKYSMSLFKSQGREGIEKIILTGGSSLLANLPNYLSSALQIKVILGDPWARIIYPEDLRPALQEIGPRFSVAAGLAMKEIR